MEKLIHKHQNYTRTLSALDRNIKTFLRKELLKICDARNTTTHTYDEEKAQESCKRIDDYYQTFKKINSISLEILLIPRVFIILIPII
jgi:nucleotidyltransferase-like protein